MKFIDVTRRTALKGLGVGLGSTIAPSCGFPPTLMDRCREEATSSNPAQGLASQASGLHAIDTFVVVMMENRSFDHLLGGLRMDPDYPARHVIDGIRGDEFNLDAQGRPVLASRMPGGGGGNTSPHHDPRAMMDAWNGGLNDRFALNNPGRHQAEVMSYLTRDQVPFQHALADQFTVCDRWFSSFMGPTWPNRFFLHAATADGREHNRPMGFDAPTTIWERMALKCHSVKHYAAGPALWFTVAFPSKAMSGNSPFEPGHIEDFFRDARSGNLPELSIIDPDFKVSDGFPQRDIALSEAFLASIYRAMAESPQWKRSLLLITYDENGGYYDHVAPPATVDRHPSFSRMGFRVPTFAVGPTVWNGKVISTTFEHSSIGATMSARFGIESLGPRMDAANDLSCCIDPARLENPSVAPRLPRVELSPKALAIATAQASVETPESAMGAPASSLEHGDPRTAEQRIASWLRHARDLEAVKVKD